MSVNSKMTAIADKIRSLLGLSGTMGLDAMATNLGTANDHVGDQTSLIAQILTALEGKAAGGGGTSGENVTVTGALGGGTFCYTYYDENCKLAVGQTTWATVNADLTFQVAKNSVAAIFQIDSSSSPIAGNGVSVIARSSNYAIFNVSGDGRFEARADSVVPV